MKIQFLEHTSLFFNQETMQYNCVIIFLSEWLTSLKVYIKPFVQTSLLSCYSISAATRTSRKETLRKSKPVSCWVKTQQLFLNSRNVLTGLLNFASIYKENKSRHYKKKNRKHSLTLLKLTTTEISKITENIFLRELRIEWFEVQGNMPMININQTLLKRTNKRGEEENFFIVSIFLKR